MPASETPFVTWRDTAIPVHTCDAVVVGSGAAGLNCALHLFDLGMTDIMLVTEGMNRGTSRNTGSDKQTYFKVTLAGDGPDSVRAMAQTLFDGGAMDGDIALSEAALSWYEFSHLIQLGVRFPHNRWGEFVGYRTDHDLTQRASSVGPLTSKRMTECLERAVRMRNIPVRNHTRIVQLCTQERDGRPTVCGAVGLYREKGEHRPELFRCRFLVYAAGGPAGLYGRSVYPVSQGGGTGTALLAGARAKNVTESQYGIASVKFRWNLSGSYQQVLPRYVSTDAEGGDEREFLDSSFSDMKAMLKAQFLKGYQWPFNPARLDKDGSSLVDLAVYHETVGLGRRVWLDFRVNPAGRGDFGTFDLTAADDEVRTYLQKSDAMQDTPIERLLAMNSPAYELYKENGIDLKTEMLEIGVCAQHNNGGLQGDMWWESNIRGLFPIGEVNGTHGVYRPGGSALNSGQTGGVRAAERICDAASRGRPVIAPQEVLAALAEETLAAWDKAQKTEKTGFDPADEIGRLRERMDRAGAVIRKGDTAAEAAEEARKQFAVIKASPVAAADIGRYFILLDHLAAQVLYLEAIAEYIAKGGVSRGSYLVLDEKGTVPGGVFKEYTCRLGEDTLKGQVCTAILNPDLTVSFAWREVRPIPQGEQWFEEVWKEYRGGKIFE